MAKYVIEVVSEELQADDIGIVLKDLPGVTSVVVRRVAHDADFDDGVEWDVISHVVVTN